MSTPLPSGARAGDTVCEAFIDFVMVSAPNLKMRNITDWSNSGGSRFQYFPKLSDGVYFTRLRELHLSSIKTSLNELKELQRTVAPTLKRLSLEFVSLNDNFKSDLTEGRKDEA